MIIKELFDRIAQWEYTKSTSNQIKAKFEIDDNYYEVDIHNFSDGSASTVEFTIGAFNDAGQWLSHNVDATGTGNELKVFATVIDIIKKTADEYNIDKLTFSSDDEPGTNSRTKLYKRMVSVLAKEWDVEIADDDDGKGAGYLLTRKTL